MMAIRNSKAIKIIIDIFMTVFLTLSFIRWEDSHFAFHIIVGTGCALFFALHVYIHWKWLKNVTKSIHEGKLNKGLRWKYLIDVLLLVVWGIAITTGFLAIGYFTFGIEGMTVFSRLHATTSRIGLVLVAIHIFQHMPQIKSYLGIKNRPNMK